MRTSIRVLLAVGLLLGLFGGLSRADDQANAIVDKAIKAMYGQAKAPAVKAMTWKGKGKVHVMGMEIPFTGTWFAQPPAQSKMVIELDAGGMKITLITASNGDKAWRSFLGQTEDLEGDRLAEVKEQQFAGGLNSLLALKAPGVTVSLAGETKVGDRQAVGVKASAKGHRDVTLYFDKETSLLLKSQTRQKDDEIGEYDHENLYGDYKDIKGVKRATKMTIKRNGELFFEAELSDFEQLDKLDENVFAKP